MPKISYRICSQNGIDVKEMALQLQCFLNNGTAKELPKVEAGHLFVQALSQSEDYQCLSRSEGPIFDEEDFQKAKDGQLVRCS